MTRILITELRVNECYIAFYYLYPVQEPLNIELESWILFVFLFCSFFFLSSFSHLSNREVDRSMPGVLNCILVAPDPVS